MRCLAGTEIMTVPTLYDSRKAVCFFLILNLVLMGPVSWAWADNSANSYPPLVIGPGDLLDIFVYEENKLPLEYQVDPDGDITFPYVGKVYVEGLSASETSEKLSKLLDKPRKVNVLIKESNTYWVSVLGDVSKPGKYQIHGKPTLLSALAEAGGPLPDTDLGGAMLIHYGTNKTVEKKKIDLSRYLRGEGVTAPEPYLYPGDILMVPKNGWPNVEEWAIIASILASAAILVQNLPNK